jgi:hypothetical protein
MTILIRFLKFGEFLKLVVKDLMTEQVTNVIILLPTQLQKNLKL